ncbi:uncharacterized protein A4U43_C04F17200 [Asparagus officinalis]|uniref:Uncharacterized protein n=1 Tax=Asparagus officinalis TaxID=4686 RepID=A0A5P1F6D4_ASPOF|nr:uncharacterized protein A4U43_C04F17200 [Asparagus officinalis]
MSDPRIERKDAVESTPGLESTHKPGKELVGSTGGAKEQAMPLPESRADEATEEYEVVEGQEGCWPFPH